MNVEQLQTRLAQVRERFLTAIELLPDEALLTPGAVGAWTVADVVAHLACWEAELVTGLAEVQRGRRPARLLAALADRESYNADRYAENHERPLDAIFNDWQGARIQLEVRLEDLTDRDLNDPRRYMWWQGKGLWTLIAELSYEHEQAHLPAVSAFADRWLAEQPAVNPAAISLEDVEVWDEQPD